MSINFLWRRRSLNYSLIRTYLLIRLVNLLNWCLLGLITLARSEKRVFHKNILKAQKDGCTAQINDWRTNCRGGALLAKKNAFIARTYSCAGIYCRDREKTVKDQNSGKRRMKFARWDSLLIAISLRCGGMDRRYCLRCFQGVFYSRRCFILF